MTTTLISTHCINMSVEGMDHIIMMQLWIELSHMVRTVTIVRVLSTMSFTLYVGNMLSNLVLAAEVVGEEVHAILAVHTADESFIFFILSADNHHITDMAGFLTNESVQHFWKPILSIPMSRTVLSSVLAEIFSKHILGGILTEEEK